MAMLLLSVEPLVKNTSVLSTAKISAMVFLAEATISFASVPKM